ncbi:MAG: protein-L-isoaspartate(D-aspartate) O-methyltransferase [Syntrophales bacterium]|jgi:protein-L-isoaspartate(D-aspartate) O-methyltransferase|nr:protein-L-isoaspartate(D-aspartate) O-methyltransferase [Syntrophales bacterium]MDY0044957.1 protein-L-isoaspartate(D-aspartate) O-methyltransferase [Syntrophales bacterium]
MNRYKNQRIKMIENQIKARGITDEALLRAMETVPRHLFVDEGIIGQAYSDNPLPIGERQTISQPYIVARMTEALQLRGDEKVLEIGTGSGYQTAVLSLLCDRVFSVERIAGLATRARKLLDSLKYFNVLIRVADGTYGWKDEAPFDAIITTAGAPQVPKTFIEQLAPGGRLVIPIGDRNSQTLIKLTRLSDNPETTKSENLGGCRFVNLIGEHGWKG